MNQVLFSGKGFISSGFLNLTPHDAYDEAINNGAVIIDVREDYLTGYKQFDVPDVFYYPFSILEGKLKEIRKDVPLIIADSAGLMSHNAMDVLNRNGFSNIANLAGGIVEWERDGLPLRTDPLEQLDGSCMCQLKPRNKLKNQ